jgi:hypothetical protein
VDTVGCPSAELWCRASSLAFVLWDAAPFVLFPAAIGGAIAGILRRRRLAVLLLVIAVLSITVPLGLGMWALLISPMT